MAAIAMLMGTSVLFGTRARAQESGDHLGRPQSDIQSQVRLPPAKRESKFAPPRVTGWEIATHARFFFSIEDDVDFLTDRGYGLLFEGELAYRSPKLLFAQAYVDQGAYGFGNGSDFGVFSAGAMMGVDHRWFSVAAGAGAMRARIVDNARRATGWGPTMVAYARLGARDGFHGEVRQTLVFVGNEPFEGTTSAKIQFRIAPRVWIRFRGGGSRSGYGFGEAGPRILVRGDRGPGSVFLNPSLGGAGMFDEATQTTYMGFLFGLGLEYRPR